MTVAATWCYAVEEPIDLARNAPTTYTVVRGDTLWDISARFLRDPWRWPDIWRMNKEQIRNPHLIFPGDIIVLDYDAVGRPALRLKKKIRSSAHAGRDGAHAGRDRAGQAHAGRDGRLSPQMFSEPMVVPVPPIPPNELGPFISAPLIVEAGELDNTARIVATQQDRVFLGSGDLAYVNNADPTREHWQVYRRGKPLFDPSDRERRRILGYEAFYLGTARQIRPGQPATFEIIAAKEEISRGDHMIPAIQPELVAYVPRRPDLQVDGRVISVYGGIGTAGLHSIISISLGSNDGLEIGHVLALERNRIVIDRDERGRRVPVIIPPERVGLAFIFRTFQNISYALVVQAEATVNTNDFARTP